MEHISEIYDFEEMRERFEHMDGEYIMDEYHKVYHLRKELMEREAFEELEQVDSAYDFLGHYLAQSFCHSCGYDFQGAD